MLEDRNIPTPEILMSAAPAGRDGMETSSPILQRWWIAFAGSAIFVVGGHLLIKSGLNSLAHSPPVGIAGNLLRVLGQPEVLGGLLVYLLGTVCWMRAVSQKEISFLYPLSSVNYVLVAAASAMLFQEVISLRRAVGMAVIMFGMILMNRRTDKGHS